MIAHAQLSALRTIVREGRRSNGWTSRPSGVSNATIRKLVDLGAIEKKEGTFPVYRVTPAGHEEINQRGEPE